jgi:hypothetical protein
MSYEKRVSQMTGSSAPVSTTPSEIPEQLNRMDEGLKELIAILDRLSQKIGPITVPDSSPKAIASDPDGIRCELGLRLYSCNQTIGQVISNISDLISRVQL